MGVDSSSRPEERGGIHSEIPGEGLDMLSGQVPLSVEDEREDGLADARASDDIGLADAFLIHEGPKHLGIADLWQFHMLILVLFHEVAQHIEVIGLGRGTDRA